VRPTEGYGQLMAGRLRSLCCILAAGALVAGCTRASTPPPSPVASHSVDYTAMKTTIEDKIGSGSLTLSTINAVLVSVDGDTKLADYRNRSKPTDALHVWSITKSVTSALVGIAIGDKIIRGLDATLPELLARYQKYLTAQEKSITLRQLMSMSAGFPSDDSDENVNSIFAQRTDPIPMILRQGTDQPPGHAFSYSSRSYHLVTAVLREGLARADRRYPRSVLDYAREKLFDPLQIDTSGAQEKHVAATDPAYNRLTRFDWGTDAAGLNSGCCLLRLRPADMIKFGELYLGGGVWHGKQILPAGWVEQTMKPSDLSSQYGLGWFLDIDPHGHPTWLAQAPGSQLIAVVPTEKLVVVIGSVPTSSLTLDTDLWLWVKDTVVPAVG
jgi:CubicO group peptidase (beta-lactamase class C family)